MSNYIDIELLLNSSFINSINRFVIAQCNLIFVRVKACLVGGEYKIARPCCIKIGHP